MNEPLGAVQSGNEPRNKWSPRPRQLMGVQKRFIPQHAGARADLPVPGSQAARLAASSPKNFLDRRHALLARHAAG